MKIQHYDLQNQEISLSVITAVLNGEKFIQGCIESVIEQRYSHVEHIIVDGGSIDKTVDIIKHYADQYSHIRWISEKDKGQSDAMNKGFKLSTGEVIVYLNADDFFEEGAFEAVVEAFKRGAKFVVGKVRVLNADGSYYVNDPKLTLGEMLRWWEPNAYCQNPSGYFYLREVQDAVGPFNTENHLAMDVEFLLEAALRYPFIKVNKTLGNFRLEPGTKTFNHRTKEFETLRFTRKYLSNFDDLYRRNYEKDLRSEMRRRFWGKVKGLIKKSGRV